MKIPRAYRQNPRTKLLWLYKTGVINRTQWINAQAKLL